MTERIQKQWTVPELFHNQRIDFVSARLICDYSRSQISSFIKSGAVTLNNKACKPKDKVVWGDTIALEIDPRTFEDQCRLEGQDIPLSIVFEDDEVLLINKPVGLVVHPGAGVNSHTLVHALLHYKPALSQMPRAGIIHRLDKDTTGLLIIAKSLTAHTALIRQMQAKEITRNYLSLVQGHLITGDTIKTGFGRHSKNRLKMSVHGKREAITHYKINKQYKDYTLLNVTLMTGRTHQIRVHLAHIKHPVVGDPLYGSRIRFPQGASDELLDALKQFKRQALHAASLAFFHPKTGEGLQFTAPLPKDFQRLLNLLDEHYEN